MDVRRVVTGHDTEPVVTLRAGDTVVQNGTRHRWRNPGTEVARMALFTCEGNHSVVQCPE